MDCAAKIIRTSIHTLLRYFHYFTTIPLLFLLPFSAAFLLSQTLFVKPIRFHGGSISDLAVSFQIKPQNVFPFVLSFPFAVSSFVVAKAAVIQAMNHPRPPTLQPPFIGFIMSGYYKPLLSTHLCSLAMIIAIKSSALSLLFVSLNSFLLPYTITVSNLALVVAGNMGTCKGHVAIYKACCLLIRKGKNCMALLLFLPTNLGLSAVEALFRFRVMRTYQFSGRTISGSMALEGLLIAYLYSLLIVLDTIICCLFYKSCEQPNSIAIHQIHRSCCDIETCPGNREFLMNE